MISTLPPSFVPVVSMYSDLAISPIHVAGHLFAMPPLPSSLASHRLTSPRRPCCCSLSSAPASHRIASQPSFSSSSSPSPSPARATTTTFNTCCQNENVPVPSIPHRQRQPPAADVCVRHAPIRCNPAARSGPPVPPSPGPSPFSASLRIPVDGPYDSPAARSTASKSMCFQLWSSQEGPIGAPLITCCLSAYCLLVQLLPAAVYPSYVQHPAAGGKWGTYSQPPKQNKAYPPRDQ